MRACALTGIRQTAVIELPKPEPGPGEVLVKVSHVGICGSDVHYWAKGRIGEAIVKHPFVVGHEVSGIVEALGPGVSDERLKPGTPVAVEPGIPCFQCESCLRGLPHCCPNVRFYGTPPVQGAFCEYVVSIPRNLEPVPEGVSLEQAAVIEPLGVAVHAVNLSKLKPGLTVGVFGAGPIGLLTLQVVRAGGAGLVVATEKIPERMEAALRMGADRVYDASQEAPGERIRADGIQLDLAFEAAGTPEAVRDAVTALRPGGQLVVIGIPDPGLTPFDFHGARHKELVVVFSRRSNYEIHQCLRLLEKGLVDTEGVVTHRFALEELNKGFDLVDRHAEGVIKAMVVVAQ